MGPAASVSSQLLLCEPYSDGSTLFPSVAKAESLPAGRPRPLQAAKPHGAADTHSSPPAFNLTYFCLLDYSECPQITLQPLKNFFSTRRQLHTGAQTAVSG